MKNKMKKVLSLLAAASILTLSLTACGGDSTETPAPEGEETASISGAVSTNGSTSMEKVVGVLSEQFMMDNTGVTVTYDPTGSGTGIEAVSNGSCDIGLSSRALKAEEEEQGLVGTVLLMTASLSSSTPRTLWKT